jgi:hypothetical protein
MLENLLLTDLFNFGRIYSESRLIKENHYFSIHLQIFKNFILTHLYSFNIIYSDYFTSSRENKFKKNT